MKSSQVWPRGEDLEELSAPFNTLKTIPRCLYILAGCLLAEGKYLARELGYRGCAGKPKYLNYTNIVLFHTLCFDSQFVACAVACAGGLSSLNTHHLQLVLIVRNVMHISDVMIRTTSVRRESVG